jgi:hypothetical protein
MEDAWYRVRDRALEELFVLGATLSEDQIDEFIAALEKKQRKYERKYLDRDEEEFRDDAYDNLCELHEDYLGRLDAAQRDRLRLAAATLRRSDATWLRERAEWMRSWRWSSSANRAGSSAIQRIVSEWEAQLDAETQRALRAQHAHGADCDGRRAQPAQRSAGRTAAAQAGGFREDFALLAEQAEGRD